VRRWLRPFVIFGLLMAGGFYLASRGREIVRHARALQIDEIVVRGNTRLPAARVRELLSGMVGQNIIWADLPGWQRELERSPWIRAAALRRSLPSTVEVVIVEREPIGIARIFDELFLIDDHGVAIDRHGPESRDFDLPLVDGLTVGSRGDRKGARGAALPVGLPGTPGAPEIDDRKAGLAARVILAVRPNPDISSRLSQIDVTDPRNASVILTDDPEIELFLGEDRFLARLQSYLDLASALRERVPEIDYVDLRFDDRIYVRPASGSKRTSLAASGGRTRD
jgi:cell division septal protein FtsQ